MSLKTFWSRTSGWLRVQKLSRRPDYKPDVDDQGLINTQDESDQSDSQQLPDSENQNSPLAVKPSRYTKREPIEKLQAGFERLIDQLHGINEHLDRQATQHEELMSRIEQLPKLLESFPAVVENQKRTAEQLIERLKTAAARDNQFIDAVEKIPTETAKQTDALVNIDHQLAAAADTDVQMTESFNNFNETLDRLNRSTASQTDSIFQMSKTFATSDRYLKYLMSRQNKRFMWIFMIALTVCVLVILILTGIIIYLRQ